MNQDDGIKLACNLCKLPRITQKLWLRTINGRDYLVCERHRPYQDRKEEKRDEAKQPNS